MPQLLTATDEAAAELRELAARECSPNLRRALLLLATAAEKAASGHRIQILQIPTQGSTRLVVAI